MTPIELSNPIYNNEDAARAHFEAVRWPNGPECPFCHHTDKVAPLGGGSMGPGWYYCQNCKDKFTARVGTVLERSHIPIHKWILAMRLMASSKKGISAHQLHRTLKVTYKTAWFLAMRIREAMKPIDKEPLGGNGQTVEVDETYLGSSDDVFMNPKGASKGGWRKKSGTSSKMKVLTLVERKGRARSVKIDDVKSATLKAVIHTELKRGTHLVTDEFNAYRTIGLHFITHRTVNHGRKEYVRGGKDGAHTNTVEGYFSVFKRGMKGVYQHCGEQHLQRYLTEFDFRYNNRIALGVDDAERTTRTIKGVEGKRLTYRRTNDATQA
jgi:transposase-like protein